MVISRQVCEDAAKSGAKLLHVMKSSAVLTLSQAGISIALLFCSEKISEDVSASSIIAKLSLSAVIDRDG